MKKISKLSESKITVQHNGETDEFETKILKKSDHPKTIQESFKLILNLFVNFST
jgi:hypothetical protein